MYTLRNKNTCALVSFSVSSNEDEVCCNSVSFELNERFSESDPYWIVDSYENAKSVLHSSTEWYNAGYSTPSHTLNPDEWEVVEIGVIEQTFVQQVNK